MLRQKEQTEDCLTGMCSSGILSPSHLHHAEMFIYSGGRNYPAAALLLLHTFVFSKGCLVGCRGARLPIALGNGKDLRKARIQSRKECCPESSKYLAPCHCLAFCTASFRRTAPRGCGSRAKSCLWVLRSRHARAPGVGHFCAQPLGGRETQPGTRFSTAALRNAVTESICQRAFYLT